MNVNARYVIAIHCLERDFGLYKEIIPELASKNLKNDYRILSQTLCELCDNGDESPNLFLKRTSGCASALKLISIMQTAA